MGKRILQREVTATRITRGPMSGGYRLSATVNGRYIDRAFLYYTKREAIRLFAHSVNTGAIR